MLQTDCFKPSLLALLIGTSIPSLPAFAGDTVNSSTVDKPVTPNKNVSPEQTMTVVASPENDFIPGGDTPVPAWLDGQIANGGRAGMLGEQNAMDIPFNITGFTAKMIRDRQAKTVAEVTRNDAGVQSVQGFGNFAETWRIRGFELDGDDMTLSGLAGVLPRQVVDTAMIERVEIFKGANSLLNGASSAGTSGAGGMINLEPKHAEEMPLTRLSADYSALSQTGVAVDSGRRFGDDEKWGARVNLVHREGETAVHNEKDRTTLASLDLDYRGDRARTFLDMAYQKKTFHGGRLGVNISQVDFIPDVPDSRHNYSQKWVYSDIESEFALARTEYDLTDGWTAWAGIGGQHSHEMGDYASPVILNENGDATIGRLDTNRIINAVSGMAGVRGEFTTGFVAHDVNLGYSALHRRDNTGWRMATQPEATNIYHTDDVLPPPADLNDGGNYYDPRTTSRFRTQGYLLSDTLGIFDKRVLLTAGARQQKVVVRSYNAATGKEDSAAKFTATHWMPTYGIVYKPWQVLSLYANHTEALQPGGIAPAEAANHGQSTGIVHARQNEAGIKVDFQRVGGSLALFDIRKPSPVMEDTLYRLAGEQRNRGIELNLFGEPVLGVRLNSSATWIDPVITRSAAGINNGKQAIGVPRFNLVLGTEYDIPRLEGLTATASINHSGSQFANVNNTKKLNSYTTLDLGMRYHMTVDEHDLTWRVGIDNVSNKKYWAAVENYGTYIFQGEPRTLKLSVSYDF